MEISFRVDETRSLGLVTLPDCILSHLLPEHASVLTPALSVKGCFEAAKHRFCTILCHLVFQFKRQTAKSVSEYCR